MELTTAVQKRFNDLNRRVFTKVSTKHPLYLNGSYPHSPWSGDIDLYSRVPPEELDSVLRILRSFGDDAEMVVLKAKVGEHKVSRPGIARLLSDESLVRKHLDSAEPGRRWVKVNWLLSTGTTIEEVSVVFDLGSPPSKTTIVRSLQQDVAKYEAEGDLYKALKRQRSLVSGSRRKRIQKILNDTQLGLMYLCRVQAETIAKSKGLFPTAVRRKALGILRENVRVRLGLNIPVRMSSLVSLGNALRLAQNSSLQSL